MEEPNKATAQDDSIYITFAELLFICLPLLTLAMVYLINGRTLREVFSSAEWSFGAAVLFGLALMRFVSGISATSPSIWQRVAFAVSAVIVFGLAPSLIILAMVLTTVNASLSLIVAQISFFLLGALVFLTLGHAGNSYLHVGK